MHQSVFFGASEVPNGAGTKEGGRVEEDKDVHGK